MAISKAVLVTGCSSGIGRATARRLARRGWTAYATARRPETLEDLEREGCRTLVLDVVDEASMRAAVEAVEEDQGAVGVLVNNAGYSQSGAIETVPMDLVRRQFETNVFGLLRLTQLVLPGMRRQGWGRVVNVSSMGGRIVLPGGGVYHATKHALEALSDALRFEVGGFGVHVVVVQPGIVATRYAEAVSVAMAELPREGPYARFDRAVERTTRWAYRSRLLSPFASSADDVAATIERAVAAERPRTRYRVWPSAGILIGLRRLVPDRAWDGLVGIVYPRPRPS